MGNKVEGVYCPGQVRNIFRYVKPDTDYFLVGGPADGDEAQVFHEKFPAIKILGFEPNPLMAQIQIDLRRFPGQMLPFALWNENKLMNLRTPQITSAQNAARVSSLVTYGDLPSNLIEVKAVRLDFMSQVYGPFKNAALWIDIENVEREALEGAGDLLKDGIYLINAECHIDGDTEEDSVESSLGKWLTQFGFHEEVRWNGQKYGAGIRWDIIFVRD